NVPVQHGDGAEGFQEFERARSVLRTPAPFGIDHPEGNMRENDDRRAVRFPAEVVRKPRQLRFAKIAEAAAFEIDDVHKADEMYTVIVEAVPAVAFCAFAVAVEISLAAAFIDDVVLAGHIADVEARFRNNLVSVIEFGRLREMRDVAGVNHEGGALFYRLHFADGLLQCAERVRIRGLAETDMAVADLQEREAFGLGRSRFAYQSDGFRYAA